jgi:hypothetical protein
VIATKFAIDGDPRSAVIKRRWICPFENGTDTNPTCNERE